MNILLQISLMAATAMTTMSAPITDKTLVVWASPANLTQRGGSALSIDDGSKHFDGIVFGELSPKKWMPGSDTYQRTQQDQTNWPEENASTTEFVQIAIVYHGAEVQIFRDGKTYAHYTLKNPQQTFGPNATVLFGSRHMDAMDKENSFVGRIMDARIYDKALDQATLAALKPGEATPTTKPWAWWSFADEGLREKTGRFTEISLVGDVKIENGCLVLNGKGASVISTSTSGAKTEAVPQRWSFDSPVPDEVVKSARLLRERMLADPYRPGYHFCVPEDQGMPGDPNGAFFANGAYHLMYLYNRTGSGFCWGHISSVDLIHWRHHPDAIGPGNGDEGCFSGGAFVDTDGSAYLSYWMLWGAKGIGLAKSDNSTFDRWTKFAENPVIHSTEWGITEVKDSQGKPLIYGTADPSNIWKKDGHYYMLTGNLLVLNKYGRAEGSPLSMQGDHLYLFQSKNLKDWKYLHEFYERNPKWTDRSEDNMCPSFLPLPSSPDGGKPSAKHLLLHISHNKGCQYYVGSYRDDHFIPDNHGRMTWVDNTFFAPEALIDGHGRQIMWAWLTDNPSGEKEKGWSGVYGLPRTLWLSEDGTLRMGPVKELESLRGQQVDIKPVEIKTGEKVAVKGISGDSFELEAESTLGKSARFGVEVRASADGSEKTLIYFDSTTNELVFDATHSGSDGRKVIERAPLKLKPGETLKLRIFVDKSVVEVFANDRQAITRRVYPTKPDSLGINLVADGTAKMKHARAWTMAPSNPY